MYLKNIFFSFTLFGTALILAACSTLPARQPANNQLFSWQDRNQSLANITHWQINGATSVITREKALSASFNWNQQAQFNYIINLFGPFDLGAVKVTGHGNQVVLQDNNGTYQASSPEQLLSQYMGWELPITNLFYWVRGMPAPNSPAITQFDLFHHLIKLKQQGWEIDYLAYTAVGKIDLPCKMILKNRYLTARLIISSWQLQR